MYCPSCGSEERQHSQFCRVCGTDLRAVRTSLEQPDAITASAISAREQVGRAIADKIRELDSGKELEHVAEDVLPHFKKFLESPEERRLRRIRAGVITATVGLGATIITLVMALNDAEALPFLIPGFIAFVLGLGLVVNGLFFTVPRKKLPGTLTDAISQDGLDSQLKFESLKPQTITNELSPATRVVSSITEHTTHHLNSEKI